ncbi:transposase [Rapidithrix thailandica]|uniref:Transposase n=1 Tax=Rapidithrix thailandica TaxID=413964 RepID=A0AAW9SFM5_9BACT
MPHLTQIKKGPKLTEDKLVNIVELILYRLKTGAQWRELPIRHFMEGPYSWQSVFHHFNRWCKQGCWQKNWEAYIGKK